MLGPYGFGTPTATQTTAAAWAAISRIGDTLGSVITDPLFTPQDGILSAIIKNTDGANALKYRVSGANDKTSAYADRKEVVAAAAVAAGAVAAIEIATLYYDYYWIEVQDSVGGSHATYTVSGKVKPVAP